MPFFRTDGQTNGQMDKRTDGRSDFIMHAPNFIWGHKQVFVKDILRLCNNNIPTFTKIGKMS